MKKFDVMWCDGYGAASRGMGNDSYIETHIKVENEEEMWKLAYLLRSFNLTRSATMQNLSSIIEEAEDWGYSEEEIEEMFYGENDYKDLFESINLDDIDGGSPWIVSITLDDKELYYDGFSSCIEEDEDEDW